MSTDYEIEKMRAKAEYDALCRRYKELRAVWTYLRCFDNSKLVKKKLFTKLFNETSRVFDEMQVAYKTYRRMEEESC